MCSPMTVMSSLESKVDFTLAGAKHRVVGEGTLPFSQESCFTKNGLPWGFSCLSLPQFPYLISEEITGRPWEKDREIEVVIQENKIGCGREWTDDAARWNCSLHGRSWEQLLLSLKVTAHVPMGMGWRWHMENLLSLSRVGPTLF